MKKILLACCPDSERMIQVAIEDNNFDGVIGNIHHTDLEMQNLLQEIFDILIIDDRFGAFGDGSFQVLDIITPEQSKKTVLVCSIYSSKNLIAKAESKGVIILSKSGVRVSQLGRRLIETLEKV